MDWTRSAAGRDEKHLIWEIWCGFYWRFDGTYLPIYLPVFADRWELGRGFNCRVTERWGDAAARQRLAVKICPRQWDVQATGPRTVSEGEQRLLLTHWPLGDCDSTQNTFDEESTLVQVMAWCRHATSHYLSQCSHMAWQPTVRQPL